MKVRDLFAGYEEYPDFSEILTELEACACQIMEWNENRDKTCKIQCNTADTLRMSITIIHLSPRQSDDAVQHDAIQERTQYLSERMVAETAINHEENTHFLHYHQVNLCYNKQGDAALLLCISRFLPKLAETPMMTQQQKQQLSDALQEGKNFLKSRACYHGRLHAGNIYYDADKNQYLIGRISIHEMLEQYEKLRNACDPSQNYQNVVYEAMEKNDDAAIASLLMSINQIPCAEEPEPPAEPVPEEPVPEEPVPAEPPQEAAPQPEEKTPEAPPTELQDAPEEKTPEAPPAELQDASDETPAAEPAAAPENRQPPNRPNTKKRLFWILVAGICPVVIAGGAFIIGALCQMPDLDHDLSVTKRDAEIINDIYSTMGAGNSLAAYSEHQLRIADVNGDGEWNADDVQCIDAFNEEVLDGKYRYPFGWTVYYHKKVRTSGR